VIGLAYPFGTRAVLPNRQTIGGADGLGGVVVHLNGRDVSSRLLFDADRTVRGVRSPK